MIAPALAELIEAADLNGLLRAVDGLCESRAWDDLLDLADACEDALERGKQLWPIAAHIDFRVALEAPAEYAAGVLEPETNRFAPGPLTEVAASTHTWSDLAPHIEDPRVAAYVAQERVMRGEDLSGQSIESDIGLPLVLQPWEPAYALATYGKTHLEAPEPWMPKARPERTTGAAGVPLDDPEVEQVLLDLVTPWTSESNGAARAAITEGGARTAIAHLAGATWLMAPLELAEAFRLMAWAASEGGARGRRRGAAYGRFAAWHTSAILAGLEWPADPDDLYDAVRELRWFAFEEDGMPPEGWILRLAFDDPDDAWAAAISATDVSDEE